MIFSSSRKIVLHISLAIFIYLIVLITPFEIHAFFEFNEEFNNNLSNPASWTISQNSGQITFTNDFITLNTIQLRKFPYIYAQNVFPLNQNLTLEFKIKYNLNNYNYGSGLSFTDKYPPYPLTTTLGPEYSIIQVWPLINKRIAIQSTICPDINPNCTTGFNTFYIIETPDFSNWHTIKIDYLNNHYKVYVDNSLKYSSIITNRKLKHIWFGSPINTGTNVIWSSFSIDFIHAHLLSSPIILLPGFGGSWNLGVMTGADGIGPWIKTPFVKIYDNFKNTLTSYDGGYKENTDYYEFYYDWRKRFDSLADDLNNYLENTVLKDKPPDTKVNLVGHSMGGLVARAYANKYGDSKIEKLITVGSPHLGVLTAYSAWEGGQAGNDISWGDVILQLFLQTRYKGFSSTKDVVRNMLPSAQEMLPIFSFLKNSSGSLIPTGSLTEKNPYLPTLIDPLSLRNKLTAIHGQENDSLNDTIEYFKVNPPTIVDKLLGLWPDGKPFSKETTLNGDLTVLTKSASLSGVLATPKVIGNHQEIIEKTEGIQEILKALDIKNLTASASPSLARTPALIFFLRSPANFKVIAPDGEIGRNANNIILRAIYSEDDKLIYLPYPQKGNYQVKLTGINPGGVYHLEIGQLGNETNKWQTIQGKIKPREVNTFNLKIDLDNPQDNLIDNPDGSTYLLIAKQELQILYDYVQTNLPVSVAQKRLLYDLQQQIKNIDLALSYLNKKNYLKANSLVLNILTSLYEERQFINQYNKSGVFNDQKAVYLKNEIEEISKSIALSWVNFYRTSGKTIDPKTVTKYKNTIEEIMANLDPYIESKSVSGINIPLGISYNLAKQKIQKAQENFTGLDYNQAYINYFSSRLLLLETLKLVK